MPLYEYKCQACGSQEEKLQGLSAPEQHACPKCGAESGMKRQLSVAAVAVSGSTSPSHSEGSPCAGGACPFART